MLPQFLPPRTNKELKVLVEKDDKETIILCHLKLAKSLSKKHGKDDEYFDAAIYGLVLGVERLKSLQHDNITGFLVKWMNRYLREVKRPTPPLEFDPVCKSLRYNEIDLHDSLEELSDLDQAIISMKSSGFTNEEVCNHLGTTQWFIQKAKSQLKKILQS